MDEVFYHKPVLLSEVLENLVVRRDGIYIDCTCGEGGHAYGIAEKLTPKGILICVDKDKDILEIARIRLKKFNNVYFICEGFENIDKISIECGVEKFDGMLLDLGVSAYHYANKKKGFSFDSDGPLVMTYSKADKVKYTAYEVVNTFSRRELAEIIFKYGEEPLAGKIAKAIVEYRKTKKIKTPRELAEVIKSAVGKRYYKPSIHPATKTFMAIRIFVNQEYEALENFFSKVKNFANPGCRVCVITFHSGEDRIVKFKMRELIKAGEFRMVTEKPIIPTKDEIACNPRARSAKLRVFEKV